MSLSALENLKKKQASIKASIIQEVILMKSDQLFSENLISSNVNSLQL